MKKSNKKLKSPKKIKVGLTKKDYKDLKKDFKKVKKTKFYKDLQKDMSKMYEKYPNFKNEMEEIKSKLKKELKKDFNKPQQDWKALQKDYERKLKEDPKFRKQVENLQKKFKIKPLGKKYRGKGREYEEEFEDLEKGKEDDFKKEFEDLKHAKKKILEILKEEKINIFVDNFSKADFLIEKIKAFQDFNDLLEKKKNKHMKKEKSIAMFIKLKKFINKNDPMLQKLQSNLFYNQMEASKSQSIINTHQKLIDGFKEELYNQLPEIAKINLKLKDKKLSKSNREYYEERRRILNISIKNQKERGKIDELTEKIFKILNI